MGGTTCSSDPLPHPIILIRGRIHRPPAPAPAQWCLRAQATSAVLQGHERRAADYCAATTAILWLCARTHSPRLLSRDFGPSSNGRTPDFGSGNDGSNPSGPTASFRLEDNYLAAWQDGRKMFGGPQFGPVRTFPCAAEVAASRPGRALHGGIDARCLPRGRAAGKMRCP